MQHSDEKGLVQVYRVSVFFPSLVAHLSCISVFLFYNYNNNNPLKPFRQIYMYEKIRHSRYLEQLRDAIDGV